MAKSPITRTFTSWQARLPTLAGGAICFRKPALSTRLPSGQHVIDIAPAELVDHFRGDAVQVGIPVEHLPDLVLGVELLTRDGLKLRDRVESIADPDAHAAD